MEQEVGGRRIDSDHRELQRIGVIGQTDSISNRHDDAEAGLSFACRDRRVENTAMLRKGLSGLAEKLFGNLLAISCSAFVLSRFGSNRASQPVG